MWDRACLEELAEGGGGAVALGARVDELLVHVREHTLLLHHLLRQQHLRPESHPHSTRRREGEGRERKKRGSDGGWDGLR